MKAKGVLFSLVVLALIGAVYVTSQSLPAPPSGGAETRPSQYFVQETKELCTTSSASHPFKFDVCYVPAVPYKHAVLHLKFPPDFAPINFIEFIDLTRKLLHAESVKVLVEPGQKTNGASMEFKLASLFPQAKSDPSGEWLELRVTARNTAGEESKIEVLKVKLALIRVP